MTKKPIKFFALALLAMLLCTSVFACESNDQGNGGDTGSAIKTLVAKEESYTLKIGESLLIKNCFTIEGNSALSAAQKACTYTSSDETVAKISGQKVEAVDSGEATITVTSKVDNTKFCEFKVKVGKVFIDRDSSFIPEEDDFSKEWNDETDKPGWFRTKSMLAQNYYTVKGVESDTWYVETTISLHEVGILAETNEKDRWPKIGIVARDPENPSNMVAFFLNASIGLNDTYDEAGNLVKGADNNSWNEFGYCEVAAGRWAWQEGVGDTDARHHDYCWKSNSNITFNTEFTLGVARIGLEFHVFINGQYAGSVKLDPTLQLLCQANGTPVASTVAFYGFNLDATFSNYRAVTDAAEVTKEIKAKIPAEPKFVEEFLVDEK